MQDEVRLDPILVLPEDIKLQLLMTSTFFLSMKVLWNLYIHETFLNMTLFLFWPIVALPAGSNDECSIMHSISRVILKASTVDWGSVVNTWILVQLNQFFFSHQAI